MPPILGHQCWSSFHDKTPFRGAKAILTGCVHADLVFLKPWRNVLLPYLMIFFVLTRQETADSPASLEQILRVIREAVFWARVLVLRRVRLLATLLSLAQIKLSPIPVILCLLIIFINRYYRHSLALALLTCWWWLSHKHSLQYPTREGHCGHQISGCAFPGWVDWLAGHWKPRRISALTAWPKLTHCKSGATIRASLQLHRVMFAVDMKRKSETGLLPLSNWDLKNIKVFG